MMYVLCAGYSAGADQSEEAPSEANGIGPIGVYGAVGGDRRGGRRGDERAAPGEPAAAGLARYNLSRITYSS